jgi:hypothetical protein
MGYLPADSSCFGPTLQQPAIIPGAKSAAEAGYLLGELIDDPNHVFLEAFHLHAQRNAFRRCDVHR